MTVCLVDFALCSDAEFISSLCADASGSGAAETSDSGAAHGSGSCSHGWKFGHDELYWSCPRPPHA